jgi:hypothetical protein
MLAVLSNALEMPWTWAWFCAWVLLLSIPYAALWAVVRVIRFAWTGR